MKLPFKKNKEVVFQKVSSQQGFTLENQERKLTDFRDIDIEDYLADMLYQDFGIARQSSAPPEYARLLAAFPGAEKQDGIALIPGGCPGLRLLAPDWARTQKPAGMTEELYAAMLLENGLIRPQDIRALPAENRA